MTAEQLEELHNLETHRRDWRSAIVEMKRLADDGSDAGDMHYWEYELKAFDRTFALTPDLARRAIAAEKIVAAYDELLATVRGECSSLLDPCRGGSDVLSFLVDEAETALAEWDAAQ